MMTAIYGSSTSVNTYIEPTMKQLYTIVVPRIAAKWKHVAYYLELHHYIARIEGDYRYDHRECCFSLLEKWIITDRGVAPKNWATLLSALKEIKELTSACSEIEKDLKL